MNYNQIIKYLILLRDVESRIPEKGKKGYIFRLKEIVQEEKEIVIDEVNEIIKLKLATKSKVINSDIALEDIYYYFDKIHYKEDFTINDTKRILENIKATGFL